MRHKTPFESAADALRGLCASLSEMETPATSTQRLCKNCTHFRRYGSTTAGTCTAGRFENSTQTSVPESYGEFCRWFHPKDKMMRGGVKK